MQARLYLPSQQGPSGLRTCYGLNIHANSRISILSSFFVCRSFQPHIGVQDINSNARHKQDARRRDWNGLARVKKVTGTFKDLVQLHCLGFGEVTNSTVGCQLAGNQL